MMTLAVCIRAHCSLWCSSSCGGDSGLVAVVVAVAANGDIEIGGSGELWLGQ